MTCAVRFEHVTKRYPRGWSEDEGPRYASLRHDVASIGRRLTRRSGRSKAHGTLALEDVSFEVEEGESFALIGPNGAGKSTALKMISRISYPTSGKVRIRGRVAALMEVGSGVHPELTGRENIWLYGQILGLRKADIRRRFDEIVEFAELGHAIDTPVKFFSSGMQLRLGFAIAAHLSPDVFVVDEALAVGDASFQAKCVERMSSLIREGRTLLFVSHNLHMLEAVCSRGLLLLDGRATYVGSIDAVLSEYRAFVDEGLATRHLAASMASVEGAGIRLAEARILNGTGNECYTFHERDRLILELVVESDAQIPDARVSVGISDGRQGPLILCSMLGGSVTASLPEGRAVVSCLIDSLPLAPRTYEVWASVREASGIVEVLGWGQVATFRVIDADDVGDVAVGSSVPWLAGPVRVPHSWDVGPASDSVRES